MVAIPSTPEAKAAAKVLMRAAAPQLMARIEELRAVWGGQITYFKAGALEYGQPSPEGWQIDQALVNRAFPPQLTALQRELARKEKLAARRRKAKK